MEVSRKFSIAGSLLITVGNYFHSTVDSNDPDDISSPFSSSAGSISCLDYKKVIACLGLIITRLQGVGEISPSVSNNSVSRVNYD